MNVCSSRYCQFNLPGNRMQPPRTRVICPFCKVTSYCSQRCRDLDWTSGHKNGCTPTAMLNSQEIAYSDKVSTLRQMKRTPEEFEFVHEAPQLGKGSFGQVRLVKDRLTGQLFAMKMMNKKEIFEYCSIENLKREIRIQRKLQHDNITQLFHYFEDKDRVYLVLEYAENGSLFQYLRKRNRLTESEAQPLFLQVCLGIEYLHTQNIIHRDLKPENILLDAKGCVKICDFGWSAENMNQKRSTFCGTIDYMAPEMIEDKPHDTTLDIWCLGILLYELLHGMAPFKGKNEIEKCNNIVKQQRIEYDPLLSKEAKDLIQNLIKYKMSERLTMRQILNHPWMKKFVSQEPIYSPNEQFINTQYLSKSTATSIPSHLRNHNLSAVPLDTSFQEYRVTKVSRHSERDKDRREIPRPRSLVDISFMDRVLMALGCIKRDIGQQQLNATIS